MYIRRSKTNESRAGEAYYTYRLVESQRIGGRVRQVTLMNLGRHFSLAEGHWPVLCARLEQLLDKQQQSLLEIEGPLEVERLAQRYAKTLLARQAEVVAEVLVSTAENVRPVADVQAVDVNSLEMTQPCSVGVEHVALHAMAELGLEEKLRELGINGVQRSGIIGNIVGRMAQPASEAATWEWLQQYSALGELIDVDFGALSHMTLYRGSDALMKQRSTLESHIFAAVRDLFQLDQAITLFDLTNTYCEGDADINPKAKRGRSKEKRSDCPLITLGLVLDGSGFVRRSETFSGNVSEPGCLQSMLKDLQAPRGALIIMDAGIATEDNIQWLATQGYRYIVVQRAGKREFDLAQASPIESASGDAIHLHKTVNEENTEVRLHCYSETRQAKEKAMSEQAMQRYEQALQTLQDGLSKPRTQKNVAPIQQRIGRLKEQSQGASQHYQVTVETDEANQIVTAIRWEKQLKAGSRAACPGVYTLRSNEMDWDAETLWRTYTLLTDLESVFRSLKSELGLRPIFHSTENRMDGHLFITVLAYQCVQLIRRKLKNAGIHERWETLRHKLQHHQRITTSLTREDGATIHIRKCTTPEPMVRKIYDILGISTQPGGTKKSIVLHKK